MTIPPPPPPISGGDLSGIPAGFSPETNSGKRGMPAFGAPEEKPAPLDFKAPPPPGLSANSDRFSDNEPSLGFKPATGRFATTEIRQPAPAIKEPNPEPVKPEAAPFGSLRTQGMTYDNGASAAGMDDKLPELVRKAVEEYCDRHFKSLAKEVIASELRRLADEKARHLVDG